MTSITTFFLLRRMILSLCLVILFAATAHAKTPTPVIFDTDMAIDDWSTLLLLAMRDDIDLLAVTANGVGETRCGPAMKNIPALLDLTSAGEVSVACGDDFPLDGYFAFPEPWRKQADTLSGVSVPASSRKTSKLHAVELIHETLKTQDQVLLLATGSLTNIAQWLEKYPDDKKKISRFVIMGGLLMCLAISSYPVSPTAIRTRMLNGICLSTPLPQLKYLPRDCRLRWLAWM